MVTRRQVLTAAGATMVAPILTGASAAHAGPGRGGPLDPTSVPKYVTDLFALPTMPASGSDPHLDRYRITVRPHRQQVLPPGYPTTPVFAYGAAEHQIG